MARATGRKPAATPEQQAEAHRARMIRTKIMEAVDRAEETSERRRRQAERMRAHG